MSRIIVSSKIIARIDKLRETLESEMELPYNREDVIQMALTAFEDVRSG